MSEVPPQVELKYQPKDAQNRRKFTGQLVNGKRHGAGVMLWSHPDQFLYGTYETVKSEYGTYKTVKARF